MNSGSFFRLNLETSKVVEGITYFDYIDLPDLNKGEDIISYPIRLTISSDRVTFFIHYFDCSEKPEKPSHSEEVILDLPFTLEEQDSLSSVIKHTYNIVFPLSGYLQNLINSRYVVNESSKTNENDSDPYKDYKNSKINKDSYSSLAIWGLLDDKREHYNLWNKNKKITKLLRKLILDFMFDLMHSDVFECSKYYNEMREGLMKDFFFSAIVKKSEYYYYRRLIRRRFDEVLINNDMTRLGEYADCMTKIYRNKKRISTLLNRNIPERIKRKLNELFQRYVEKEKATIQEYPDINAIKHLYAEKLDDAEAEWQEVIISPMADKHFSFYPKWYEDQPSSGKEKGSNVSESWFINPEAEMERIAFPLVDKHGHYLHMNSTELCDFIGSSDDSSIEKRKTKISKWYYQRYDFADTFRLHLFNGWNAIFMGLMLLFSIVAFCPYFWTSAQNIALFPWGFSICHLLAALCLFFITQKISHLKSKRIDNFFVARRRKKECLKLLRLSLIWALFGCFLFFYNLLAYNWLILVVKVLVLIGTCILILRYSPKLHTLKNIHLFMPRLVASITTAWIMLVIGNELFKERISIPIGVILSVVVLAFLLYESNKALPNISTWNRIGRALELMLISFSMSLIIGIFAIDIVSLDLIQHTKDSFLWPFLCGSEACTITVIPEYLIQFSFLAMFIGVFIQMIFEEKSITDM